MTPSRAVPLLLVLGAVGCSLYHTDTLRLDPAVRPQTVADSVRVLGQEPTQPYRVVALVSVSDNLGMGANYGRLTWRMAQEAAKLGGHAVLLGAESLSRTNDQTTLTGKVLVFEGAVPADAPLVRPRSSAGPTVIVVAAVLATTVLGVVAHH